MSEPIPLIDLERQHRALEQELSAAFQRVLRANRFILGEEVQALERELAALIQVPHALGVSSGTDALILALKAARVGPGDEVITTPFSFFATIGAILQVGATPRFADLEPGGFNLDPKRVAESITERTRAVLCVHLFGAPAAARELRALCDREGLTLIEDAAQALGASIDGQPVGSFGHLGCFSFFPSKPLGGFGDGGLISTADDALAARCRLLRAHGAPRPHEHQLLGGNHRLDALQAALLRVKLPHLFTWRAAREAHARAYDAAFMGRAGLAVPSAPPGASSAHAHHTLRFLAESPGVRDRAAQGLAARGVSTAVYYAKPLYAQPVPELQATLRGDEPRRCPEAERRCQEVLTLPLFPELTTEERERVIAATLEQLR
ncbi:MAG: DegT/DnrJ/EryC1/StrS family aminotransferase [Polyangiaceae bacterium]|nr:DegT/DnrJ/EryC1/StrS family aminotransferase [Polyangiaceae bacterium]MCW5791044.1 DegT/DnrJ/EryC1/StrS family aminotransferase [Polyangiaceae bacterium]